MKIRFGISGEFYLPTPYSSARIDTHITPKLTRKGDTVNELVDR
jgi:hypothetical protein